MKTPLDTVFSWYDSQQDTAIKTDFTNFASWFHPDPDLQRETRPEVRNSKFAEYLSVALENRREIVRRSLSIVGLIDAVTGLKISEEESIGVNDSINAKWIGWIESWKELRLGELSTQNITDWYFGLKAE